MWFLCPSLQRTLVTLEISTVRMNLIFCQTPQGVLVCRYKRSEVTVE